MQVESRFHHMRNSIGRRHMESGYKNMTTLRIVSQSKIVAYCGFHDCFAACLVKYANYFYNKPQKLAMKCFQNIKLKY